MTRRRTAALALATATVLTGSLGAPALASTAERAQAAPKATTVLTILAPRCEGCQISAHSGLTSDYQDVWQSRAVTVRDGIATFRVPTDRTHGLSLSLTAPWEGAQGYVTVVAMRYAGEETGDTVGFREARSKRRASACWAGTTAAETSIKIRTRKVRVDGVQGRVDGTIAWARTTPEWLAPMRRVFDGVMGGQDMDFCEG